MPHIDFNYDGLGEARRVFSQKHARLLTARDRLERPLAQRVREIEAELRVRHQEATEIEEAAHWSAGAPALTEGITLLDLYDQHREWEVRVLRTVREMALAYLVAAADAFVGRWREENGLPAGVEPESAWWYSAKEHEINVTLADLHKRRPHIPLLALRPDVAVRLRATLALRRAVMHQDSEGVDDISEEDLDAALLMLDSIVRALALVTHDPVPNDRDGTQRRAFIAEALEER